LVKKDSRYDYSPLRLSASAIAAISASHKDKVAPPAFLRMSPSRSHGCVEAMGRDRDEPRRIDESPQDWLHAYKMDRVTEGRNGAGGRTTGLQHLLCDRAAWLPVHVGSKALDRESHGTQEETESQKRGARPSYRAGIHICLSTPKPYEAAVRGSPSPTSALSLSSWP
jgi:hypothetical protein